ncbi:MAG: nitrite reductase large subunit NirB [Kiritimatiellae bacterium]|nr:nitrite reductase large subunit NirB [Kiritimatiellia bacterium]MDD4025507.1 nitrite reductase large subunit NirB [Kiritimatiellia bacterium]
MSRKERIIIIGNGMAGGKLAEEIVARGRDRFDITVIGDEPQGNYNRIKLVVKLKEPDLPDLFLNTPEWYIENGITACLGHPVTAIDRLAKTVSTADGRLFPYDRLVLATGSRPIVPPMKGLDLPGVFTLRRLDDVERVTDYLRDKNEVAVVGGGLLGLELALMLRLLGKRVTVSHLMPTLMEMQLPEEAGRYLKHHLEALGIAFVMGTYITELLGSTAGVAEALFKDGSTITTDAVFFNCGIRPNTDLARATGLTFNKGVAVNERLQTSDHDIYACGECLEFHGQIWGLVAPVYEQARTLAAVLCGEAVTYAPAPPTPTRLKSDIPVVSMGTFKPNSHEEVTLFTDPATATFKQLIIRDNTLVGAVLVGEDLNADLIALHYTAKIPLPARRADLLFPGARSGDAIVDGKLIPDEAQVCDCNGVSAGTIRRSIHKGNDTLLKVMTNTKAGTGCGNCKNKIKALLISEVGELRADPAEKYYVPGIAMDRPTLTEFIRSKELRSVSRVFASIPGSTDDSKTRMGLDYLLNYIWLSDYTVEKDARCANDRYSGNIQNDGRYSVIPNIPGGVATAAQLRSLADVADRYDAMIKVTGSDRIGLYSVHKKDLRAVWRRLQMGSGHAFTKSFRACKSCVGSTHCRFGLMDSLALGQRLGNRYRGIMGPAKVKLGVSGCPRNCSEATIKDFGAVAVEGGWDLYIGGNGGAHVYVAHKIAQVKDVDAVIRVCDRFYEYYRRYAKYGERTALFVERVGLKTVVDALLNAPPQELQELEDRFQQTLDNYRDPWQADDELNNEAESPAGTGTEGFTALADVSAIPAGSSRLFHVGDTPVAVFHGRDGRWVAAHGVCPHKSGPLVDSIYGNGRLVCPLHSYSFDVATGACDNPEIRPVQIFETAVRDGQLNVRVAPPRQPDTKE